MDFQVANKKIIINENKNIGKVLYIVEGEKREINIIAKIFLNILGYKQQVISVNRNGERKYKNFTKEENPQSQIVIINSEYSNIGSIKNTEFIDKQFELLKEYNLEDDYKNSAIYYIFDCDRKEDIETIKELIKIYSNSREPSKSNEFNTMGGMLLLNYPAIETFIISNFEKELFKFNERFDFEQKKLKQYISDEKYVDSNFSKDTLVNAFMEMMNSLRHINIEKINLDNITEFNEEVYKYELKNKNQYMLSLLLISFLDLGIIEVKNIE